MLLLTIPEGYMAMSRNPAPEGPHQPSVTKVCNVGFVTCPVARFKMTKNSNANGGVCRYRRLPVTYPM